MGVAEPMHVKSDSEVTSCLEEASSTPPRSPRASQPLYYVQSPSHSHHHNHSSELNEKMSYGSSPYASPPTHHHHQYHYYHCSPIHHSRDQSSTTSRFSASLKNPGASSKAGAWQMIPKEPKNGFSGGLDGVEDDEEEEDEGERAGQLKLYVVWFLLCFVLLFTVFSLILWGASLSYKPKIFVKKIVFERMNVQAGMDGSGVATDMLSLKLRVKIYYRNPSTFFGFHVTSTPLQLHYLDLLLASGLMKQFYQPRKSQHIEVVVVQGYQVPLYGGVPLLSSSKNMMMNPPTTTTAVPMNLTFQMRSRAYILGSLVKPNFYFTVLCQLTLSPNHLGNPINFTTHSNTCVYR